MKIYHAFVDESGTTSPTETDHLLVIAVLGTEDPDSVSRVIHRIRKKDTSTPDGELKARKLKPAKIKKVLEKLTETAIQIIAVIVDPYILCHPPEDPEDIYRWAISRAIYHLVERFPNVEIVLDRRYTKEMLRIELEKTIRQAIMGIPEQLVIIRQEDSSHSKELQAVDFIAWAFFQKYERNDSQYYDLISNHIVKEEWLNKQQWDTR